MSAATNPPIRSILLRICERSPVSYVVGGTVREHLKGESSVRDLDIAVKNDGFKLAAELAALTGSESTFVPLDPDRGSGRLIVGKPPYAEIDISSFKGESIDDDLRSRDFTINAMAISLSHFLGNSWDELLDPLGGESDLAGGVIRACSRQSISDDPLRILRAHRFQAELGFIISPATLEMMKTDVSELTKVATERVLEELLKILSAAESIPALKEMNRVGVIDVLMPELAPMRGCTQNEYHHLDVFDHTIQTVRNVEVVLRDCEEIFSPFGSYVIEYVRDGLVKGRPHRALLKLAALFHDSGKPHSKTVDSDGRIRFFGHEKQSALIFTEVGDRIRLSKKEISLVSKWIMGHMRPMIFTYGQSVSRKALYRLHRDFGRDIVGLLVLFLADLSATRGPARSTEDDEQARVQAFRSLAFWLESQKDPPARLLNGRDLISLFGLQPGPHLGRILTRLDELQGAGEIAGREQAIQAAKRFVVEELGRPPKSEHCCNHRRDRKPEIPVQ
jgi:poly(A) polymerase